MALFSLSLASCQQALSNLDTGLLHRFAEIKLTDGAVVEGEIVAVVNERPFMWNPMERDTIAVFKLGDELLGIQDT